MHSPSQTLLEITSNNLGSNGLLQTCLCEEAHKMTFTVGMMANDLFAKQNIEPIEEIHG